MIPTHARARVIGQSAALLSVMRQVEQLRASQIPVCVFGESGVGKELIARAIHASSRFADGPFVAVNCAAFPESLQESEFFGHERGAFTGATELHRGCFEQASCGTLFLDEVSEMPPSTQAKLLRVLQERVYRRVGGCKDLPLHARIVSATNKDLEAEVRAGRFRADLFFRLVAFPVEVPPLRARRDDIPLLVAHQLRRVGEELGRSDLRVEPAALERLVAWDWPGNVRQLENVVQRAVLSSRDGTVRLLDLPDEVRTSATSVPAHPVHARPLDELPVAPLAELERRAIEQALARSGGNVERAARELGIGRATIYRKLARATRSSNLGPRES